MANIMIVDDDPVSRSVLKTILAEKGHRVTEVGSGTEAIAKYDESPADVVFMDIFMPGKDGVQTIREMLAERPGLRIVAVSGGSTFTSFESLEWARFHGAREALQKPYQNGEVAEALKRVLG